MVQVQKRSLLHNWRLWRSDGRIKMPRMQCNYWCETMRHIYKYYKSSHSIVYIYLFVRLMKVEATMLFDRITNLLLKWMVQRHLSGREIN